MPTVVFLDSSTSMSDVLEESVEHLSASQLALSGLKTFIDNMKSNCKYEHVALTTYSNQLEVASFFTKDYDEILLRSVEINFKYEPIWTTLMNEIQAFICSNWDHNIYCNIILVTCSYNFFKIFNSCPDFSNLKIIVCYFGPEKETLRSNSKRKFLSCNVDLYLPEAPISLGSTQNIFLALVEKYYFQWNGQLVCGSFSSKMKLFPRPEPYTEVTDFDTNSYIVKNTVEICGFIEMKDLGSPRTVSVHLVLPYSLPPLSLIMNNLSTYPSDDVKRNEDLEIDSQSPSFCVLLHGALKAEQMAAICNIGNNWYGILSSRTDPKKKSNLMLSLLEPGTEAVPWLGDLNKMTILTNPHNVCLPNKNVEEKVFYNCAALKKDLQKIVRLAKKIPEKTLQFYRELNRVRRLAIAMGFLSLLDALRAMLELECTLLPGSAHPACALQLTHAAGRLREPLSHDYKYTIFPMKTSF